MIVSHGWLPHTADIVWGSMKSSSQVEAREDAKRELNWFVWDDEAHSRVSSSPCHWPDMKSEKTIRATLLHRIGFHRVQDH